MGTSNTKKRKVRPDDEEMAENVNNNQKSQPTTDHAATNPGYGSVVKDAEQDSTPKLKSKRQRKAEKKALNASKAAQENENQVDAFPEPASSLEDSSTSMNLEENIESMASPMDGDVSRQKKRKVKAGPSKVGEVPARFIVFIGNLPFSATTETIQRHFAAIKPKSVRHLTHKDQPTKSKGCAFIEFDGFDRMKTCLKHYHHSVFEDGISTPRKINVELTAGGGGKTKHRKAKIGQKNHKLNEERSRRYQDEKSGAAADKNDHSDIHPSRRAQLQNLS